MLNPESKIGRRADMDTQTIELALEELRPSFEADSFGIVLESLSPDGHAVIAITATPQACYDCLIPDAMLTQVVEACVRRHAPDIRAVDVIKRGFPTTVG